MNFLCLITGKLCIRYIMSAVLKRAIIRPKPVNLEIDYDKIWEPEKVHNQY